MQAHINPSLAEVTRRLLDGEGNMIPVFRQLNADLLTPVSAYLKIAKGATHSFLLESIAGGERVSRYSFIGANPRKIIATGPNEAVQGDPLAVLEPLLRDVRYMRVQGLPAFTGGAVGYISYDCVRHFEPRTVRPLKDVLQIPEAVLMFCDTIIVFDHAWQTIKVVAHVSHNATAGTDRAASETAIAEAYAQASTAIDTLLRALQDPHVPLPQQGTVTSSPEPVSNVGQQGYEDIVRSLKHFIHEGDIIQAVPSQRLARPTELHPFNLYRHLRCVNPSPYMFYVDLKDFQLIGASPEAMVKVTNGEVETHPIAGTRRRGRTPEEDVALEKELLADEKERAEHIMLVDLGRNDVNRVCVPSTVRVEDLMHVQRFSHVMHIVSRVLGQLRAECTPFDAFRSIFPAGTVSGAPKIRAIELISEHEKECRGVYAGAVGYFSYSGDIDTCIAIRTILHKNRTLYLQAGAGIVFDSDPTAEYEETIAKLNANLAAIRSAEQTYAAPLEGEQDGSSASKRRKQSRK
eukprot:Unigene6101_Nuclearia_a/m.18694 Unigene6101_Nuclearia_a/g.18694  ORF Unigene6101_Nuclearia_a/g.18694 Unigene6101_Nuclearia_a/m.18694 type:complete len:519 (-) Unigene6101_Nuclearia_a:698-2254(-)